MESEERPDRQVRVTFTRPEALVLFEWLHRVESEDSSLAALNVEDQAEQRVLWDLSAVLERVLDEPFGADYTESVDAARSEVRDPAD